MDPFDLKDWPGFRQAGGSLSSSVIDQIVIDTRRITSPHSLFVALKGKKSDGHKYLCDAVKAGAKYALVHCDTKPVENLQLLKVGNPLFALQEIVACYRKHLPCEILAISGAFGKTMVKELLLDILRQSKKAVASPESFNSQIGVALSLLSFTKKDEIAIVEAGISEKGEMARLANMIQPKYGILTHLGKKHLATLGNIHTSALEMTHLFQGKLKWTLLPNHPLLQKSSIANSYFWDLPIESLPHAEMLSNTECQITFPDKSTYRKQLSKGYFYYSDLVNIAIKAAWLLGISTEDICKTLEKHILEPMKIEIWRSSQNVTFINHFYSSDPQSVDQAIQFFKTANGRKLFLFGGLRKNTSLHDYDKVAYALHENPVDVLCLYGEHPFENLIQKLPCTTILKAKDYQEALAIIKPILKDNDTVLIKGSIKENFDAILDRYHGSLLSNLCTINLAAVENNINAIRKKLPIGTRIMVMVKASAYGTDDLRMAQFLTSCNIDILGVSYADEAISLLERGATQEMFVLNAAPYEVEKIVKWNLQVGLSDMHFIDALGRAAAREKKKIKVHLHIDTGMCRFGCRPEEALTLAKRIQLWDYLHLEGIMTHFSSSDSANEDEFTRGQTAKLDNAIHTLEKAGIACKWRHAANSGGALRFHFPQYNMVRLGLAVYGLYPSKAVQEAMDLKLAVSFTTRIVGINECNEGDSVSYGRTYKAPKKKKIAVLPVGYFDGLHRNYSGKAFVLIHGKKAPMVGKICMDFMMVDISDIEEADIGDEVLIFGEDDGGNFIAPEDLALKGNSIMHELITCLGPRVQRMFIFEESKQHR